MDNQCRLTVLFDDPFWIGLYERIEQNQYWVCKITFGAEPKDFDVYHFLLGNWRSLKFSPPIQADSTGEKKVNPKRLQRDISSQLENRGVGTKAQQALKLQHEQCRQERTIRGREQKEAERQRQYALRQEKKRAKHRGK